MPLLLLLLVVVVVVQLLRRHGWCRWCKGSGLMGQNAKAPAVCVVFGGGVKVVPM
jgi:hypothetical protein